MILELDDLRAKGMQLLAIFAVAAALILLIAGAMTGALLLGLAGVLIAALPVWFGLSRRGDRLACALTGATFPLFPALALAIAKGSGWTLDMHMLFFATLAMLAILADWRVIIAATGTTAVHHLLLNFVAPAYVFPDGANLLRVLFHAVVVVLESGILVLLCLRIESLLDGLTKAHEQQAAQDALLNAERERVASEQRQVLGALGERLATLATARDAPLAAAIALDRLVALPADPAALGATDLLFLASGCFLVVELTVPRPARSPASRLPEWPAVHPAPWRRRPPAPPRQAAPAATARPPAPARSGCANACATRARRQPGLRYVVRRRW